MTLSRVAIDTETGEASSKYFGRMEMTSHAKKAHLLFGIAGTDLDDARRRVETALGICMAPHESSYRCGDYYRCGDAEHEHFILQQAFDEADGEWVEPAFTKHGLLLYVNEASNGAEMQTSWPRSPTCSRTAH